MSLMHQPDARGSVFAEAMLAVVSVERRHSFLRLDAAAKRLIDEHPHASISLDDMKDYMLRFALRQGVAIEIG